MDMLPHMLIVIIEYRKLTVMGCFAVECDSFPKGRWCILGLIYNEAVLPAERVGMIEETGHGLNLNIGQIINHAFEPV